MKNTYRAFIVFSLICFASTAFAANEAKRGNVDSNRMILKGYDPVSYFDGKPAKGSEKITTEYGGAVYRFASEDNRKKFLAEPTKYQPEYNGWCAKAIADKSFVDIDPLNYKITNGRLFLFYKGLLGDALTIWNKDEANMTQRADKNWKELLAK